MLVLIGKGLQLNKALTDFNQVDVIITIDLLTAMITSVRMLLKASV